MQPITLTPDLTNTFYKLDIADFQALSAQGVLILATNPDGTQIQVSLTGQVYDAPAAVATDQAQLTADQSKLSMDQAAEQSAK